MGTIDSIGVYTIDTDGSSNSYTMLTSIKDRSKHIYCFVSYSQYPFHRQVILLILDSTIIRIEFVTLPFFLSPFGTWASLVSPLVTGIVKVMNVLLCLFV